MMTSSEINELVRACSYKPGWKIILGYDKVVVDGAPRQSRLFIQVEVTTEAEASMESAGPDKGKRSPWKGGKKYLSQHMCRQEIVSAVYGIIEQAELHEIREWFRYKGASIYNPHLDPDVLAVVARKKVNFNVRDNAMTMVEP